MKFICSKCKTDQHVRSRCMCMKGTCICAGCNGCKCAVKNEYYIQTGRFYGYPECCILEFLRRHILREPCPESIFKGSGFAPCDKCNHIKTLDYILANRDKDAGPFAEVEGQLGLIFHWGLYSVPAYDDFRSANRRKMKNGSEWYLARLNVKKGDFHPPSGWEDTQTYHKEVYGDADYYSFRHQFNSDSGGCDFEEWMKYAICV
jgi:alpha-L-fucosidase-like protein